MPASKLTTEAAAAAARVDAAAVAAAVAASSSSTFGGIVLALSRHCARGGLVRCLSVFFAGCLAVSLAYSIYTFPLLIPLPLAVPLPLSPVTILNPVCPACAACCHSQKSWASIFWADNNNNYRGSSRDGQQAELRRQRARSSSAAAHTHVQTHT